MTFNDVVEVVKQLSTDEKEEVQRLLQEYICEERRDRIYNNLRQAQQEEHRGELQFSASTSELKQMLED